MLGIRNIIKIGSRMVLASNTLRFVTLTILIMMYLTGSAQGIGFTISAPVKVKVGEAFQLKYIVKGENEPDVKFGAITALKNFEILFGPGYSKTINTDNVMKRDSFSIVYLYTLRANRAGKYVIPTSEVTVGSETYKCKPHKIEVAALTKEEIAAKKKALEKPIEDIFVKTIVSRHNVSLIDTLMLTYRLYTRFNITQIVATDYPSLNEDFYSRDITPRYVLFGSDIVDDIEYTTVDIRRLILQPQSEGMKRIREGYVEVEYTIPEEKKGKGSTDENRIVIKKTKRLPLEDAFVDIL